MLNVKLWKIVLFLLIFSITFSSVFGMPSESSVLIGPVLNNSINIEGVRSVNLRLYSASSGGSLGYNQTRSLNFTDGFVIFQMNNSFASVNFLGTPYIEYRIENQLVKNRYGQNRTLWSNPQITTLANQSEYVNASGVLNEYWYNSASEVIGGFTGCIGTYYLGADGACHADSVGYSSEAQLVNLLDDDYANKTEWDTAKAYDCGSDYEMMGLNASGGIKCQIDDSIVNGGTEVYVGSSSWVRLKANSGFVYWDGSTFFPGGDGSLGKTSDPWSNVVARNLKGAWNGTGTLTNSKWCKYNSATGKIDCNVDVVTNTDNQTIKYNPSTNYLCISGGNCTDLSELDDAITGGGNSTTEIRNAINNSGRYEFLGLNLSDSLKMELNDNIYLSSNDNTINSGSIHFKSQTPEGKSYVIWYNNTGTKISAMGCHYNESNGDIHQHCSILVYDKEIGLETRLSFNYGENNTEDVEAFFHNLGRVRLGNGTDLRLTGSTGDIKSDSPITLFPESSTSYGWEFGIDNSNHPEVYCLSSNYCLINDGLKVLGFINASGYSIYASDFYDSGTLLKPDTNSTINRMVVDGSTTKKLTVEQKLQDGTLVNKSVTWTDETGGSSGTIGYNNLTQFNNITNQYSVKTSWLTSICPIITGSADLCDGSDATGSGGITAGWVNLSWANNASNQYTIKTSKVKLSIDESYPNLDTDSTNDFSGAYSALTGAGNVVENGTVQSGKICVWQSNGIMNCTYTDISSSSGGNSTSQIVKAIEQTGLNFSVNKTIRFNFRENGMLNGDDQAVEFNALNPEAKSYLSWYGYLLNDSSGNMQRKYIGWFGCHYNTTGNSDPHEHCSIETLDLTTGTINTRFEITYGDLVTDLYAKFSGLAYVELGSGVDLLMNGASSDIRHTTDMDIYPGNQAIFGLRISNNTKGMTLLSALGQGQLGINDRLYVAGNINTTGDIYLNSENGNSDVYVYFGNPLATTEYILYDKASFPGYTDTGFVFSDNVYLNHGLVVNKTANFTQGAYASAFYDDGVLLTPDTNDRHSHNTTQFTGNSTFKVGSLTAWLTSICSTITGGSGLCDGTDDIGSGGASGWVNLSWANNVSNQYTIKSSKVKSTIDAFYPNLDTDSTNDFNGAYSALTGAGNVVENGTVQSGKICVWQSNGIMNCTYTDLQGSGSDSNISVTSFDITGSGTSFKFTLQQKNQDGIALTNLSDTLQLNSDEYTDQIQFTGTDIKKATVRSTGFNFTGTFNDRTLILNTSQFNNNKTIKTAYVESLCYNTEAELTTLLDNNYQPLESTLTDIADGTIAEDLINTANPWADNEVANDITASNYLPLAGGTMSGHLNMSSKNVTSVDCIRFKNGASWCGI